MASLTMKEIAELADVSPTTVSRVLNNHPNVRTEVRDRVMKVVKDHNYTPNAAARSLSSRKAGVVSLLFIAETERISISTFFALMVQGVVNRCMERGFFVNLAWISSKEGREFYQAGLQSQQFDGAIVYAYDYRDPMLSYMLEQPIPIVLLDKYSTSPKASWVHVDNTNGAKKAVQHLMCLGHTRIAMLSAGIDKVSAIDRLAGYKAALAEAQLPFDEALVQQTNYGGMYEDVLPAVKALLALPTRPTAIFAANDLIAYTAINILEQYKYDVPNDIAVVGFDNFVTPPASGPQLTTVVYPMAQVTASAVDALIDQIETSPPLPQRITVPAKLVIRRTCGNQHRVQQNGHGQLH